MLYYLTQTQMFTFPAGTSTAVATMITDLGDALGSFVVDNIAVISALVVGGFILAKGKSIVNRVIGGRF